MIPRGKGIYGRSRFLDHKYAKFLADHGIEWYVPISLAKAEQQIEAGIEYGINVHLGLIPHPNKTRGAALEGLKKITTACNRYGAWPHLDTEEGVFWREAFCRLFLKRAREQVDCDDIGVTCYGSHKGKLAGLQGADYYLAQVYDRYLKETEDQEAMFLNSLMKFYKISGTAPVGVGVGAFLNYKKPDGTKVTTVKPLERFKRHIAGIPKKVTFAAVWTLPLFQSNPSAYRDWWKAIGEWEVG